jgi:hypothetical protein
MTVIRQEAKNANAAASGIAEHNAAIAILGEEKL